MTDLKGQVDVPGIGGVDKRVLIGVGGVAAVFIGWRYYKARSATAYDPNAAPVDPGMEDPGVLPSVAGAVSPNNGYGLADSSSAATNTSDAYGFHGTTDSQWTQYATAQLTSSDQWSYTAIVTALGKYIGGKPLSSTEQQIVGAAIALAGHPPEHPNQALIPGGDVPLTVAPTGVKVTAVTTTTAKLSWNAVAGAEGYRIYRSGVSQVVGVANGTSGEVGGLTPNTSYSFQVAAFTQGGQIGPKSSSATGKTTAVKLAAPGGVHVSSIAATQATVSWTKVAGATSYRVYVNGSVRGAADGGLSSNRITGLSKKTRYTVQVAADTTNQEPGPKSKAVTFTTKSK